MKTILFVCTANIARSPMAEALFNKKIDDMGLHEKYQAISAGNWARYGIPAPPDGQQVMKDRGLDTSTHLSQPVTLEMMESVDVVLTMEAGHKEALRVEFPWSENKVFMISEMVDSETGIDDPFTLGLERFEETAQELDDILEHGMAKILELASDSDDEKDTTKIED